MSRVVTCTCSCCTYRGPSFDGRIKPDVCAPGVKIRSSKSSGCIIESCDTMEMSGTSMATPIAAGLATLVRQYFMDGYYPDGVKNPDSAFVPMGALIKAVMVNSGRKLTGTEATRQV